MKPIDLFTTAVFVGFGVGGVIFAVALAILNHFAQ